MLRVNYDCAMTTGVEKVLQTVEPIIERSKDIIGTHYEDCYLYHIACLAVFVRHALTEGEDR